MPSFFEIRQNFLSAAGSTVQDIKSIYDQPTYLAFKVIFHFNDEMSPLFDLSNEHSAYNYLLSNNYEQRAAYLKQFIEELTYISKNAEWYFQSIDGLGDIWNFDFYTEKVRTDKNITFSMLEGLDLRVTKCMDYYYRACFDSINRREIVPINLRYFSFSIYVTDFRFFHERLYDLDGGFTAASPNLETSQSRTSLMFRLENCEFDKLSRSMVLDSVSNIEFEQQMSNIIIKHHGNVFSYPSYILDENVQLNNNTTLSLNSDIPQNIIQQSSSESALDAENRNPNSLSNTFNNNLLVRTANDLQSRIQNTSLRDRLSDIGQRSANGLVSVANRLTSQTLGRAILGNVYSTRPSFSTIRQALDSGLTIGNIF